MMEFPYELNFASQRIFTALYTRPFLFPNLPVPISAEYVDMVVC